MTPLRVGVIGLGLIGGSIAQRLGERPDEFSVSGFDPDGAPRDGIELVASARELAGEADLVVVAVPPERTADLIAEALAANDSAAVTDVASVKAPIVSKLRELASDAADRYLPGHPLAGAEESGWDAARPSLLDAATWAVCPPRDDAPGEALCRAARMLDAFEARIVVCDAHEHDRAVARTSHAPHLVAQALAAPPPPGGPTPELTALLSGGAFRDMTRVAGADPELWRSILALNHEAVRGVLDEFIAHFQYLRDGGGTPGARATVELLDRLRWETPSGWEERTLDWPAWNELIELGRRGTTIRRPRLEGNRITVEATA